MSLSGLGASRRMRDVVRVRRGMGVKAARRERVRMDLRRAIVDGDVSKARVCWREAVVSTVYKNS